jgi:signal transduction histidine kinase
LTSIKIKIIWFKFITVLFILFNTTICFAEEKWPYQRLSNSTYSEVNDSIKINSLIKLASVFQFINNAIKFSFSEAKIIIESNLHHNICAISIKDFGTGMNPKELEIINQGDTSKSKLGTIGEKGNGIGLMISRDFIIQNNGKLIVHSESGLGSTFVLELPSA